MKLFAETDLPVIFLSIIAMSQITGFDSLRRVFLRRTDNLHDISSGEVSEVLNELCEYGWIAGVPHPRDKEARIPRFPLVLAPAGRVYLAKELARLEQDLVRRGLAGGEGAIAKKMRLLTTIRVMLRVLGCEAGMPAIQVLRKRLIDEQHPS